MSDLSNSERKWPAHVRWELKWSALELLAVLTGLYLLLEAGPARSGLGSILLTAVVVEAFAVRAWRYGRTSSD
jgi:hypothetical protein